MASTHPRNKSAKHSKAPVTPKTISGFTVLPLTVPALACLKNIPPAKHYLYIKPHESKTPSSADSKCLYLANVPFDSNEANIRALFQEQLGGVKVASLEFDSSIPEAPVNKRRKTEPGAPGKLSGDKGKKKDDQRGKKRKRDEDVVAEGVVEDEKSALPKIWPSELRKSGSGALVVFVDKASARGAMKEVQKAVKEGREVRWKGAEGLGVERYRKHQELQFPSKATLQSSIASYLSQFSAAEMARNRTRAKLRSVPDEDGFVTVVRGGRSGPARLEEAEKKKAELEERKKNNGVKDDFYRFQTREKKKEAEGELRRKFEADRRRVEEMRMRRGKVRLEG
ncbi:ribosomal RNA-processing protein 7-domain-containing protein [Clohesyomyces aquaticus]|uniref:Ribosomal RNA-processing protein 7-domain-containing protein n=1 Tax=Clohesyomyces aquaticus TaxID=1231657 RepID=A0A1Y1ZZU6_9PLEO|nr:ribosomal RNA-processing protein 7-domain-containing protein [Clohesyomyces aquaticus]